MHDRQNIFDGNASEEGQTHNPRNINRQSTSMFISARTKDPLNNEILKTIREQHESNTGYNLVAEDSYDNYDKNTAARNKGPDSNVVSD